ncbi:hypothetical protein HY029_02755 [Candidatus Gottesmanbacteria bacterium]|nr:hypothetical protein [Candidatus Gottesmanbacteria bacterium]
MEEQLNVPDSQVKNPKNFEALLQMDQQKQNLKAKESYWKAYLMSILLPPIGIYYFIKYFFFIGDSQSKKAAVLNLVMTIVSLILNIWLIQLFFSSSFTGNNQNLNTIKELITPENQKSLQELIQ